MISKKRAAIGLAIGALIGLQISGVYVPIDFERPTFYKFLVSYVALSAKIADFSERWGFGGPTYVTMRKLLRAPEGLIKASDPQVTELDRTIEGVRVRVYQPKGKTTEKRPVMVYFHGGGYYLDLLDAFDSYLYEFVKRLDMIVIAVDYDLAPEHSYPEQNDQSMRVVKYVLKQAGGGKDDQDLVGLDPKRVVLAGDEAGGQIAAVLTQQLAAERFDPQPRLQVLIYPWVQMANPIAMPSTVYYHDKGLFNPKMNFVNYAMYYMGITNLTQELEFAYVSNSHFMLIKDEAKREKYMSFFDTEKLPDFIKKDKSYYKGGKDAVQNKYAYPVKFDQQSILNKDIVLANKFKQLFEPDVSPLFAEIKDLKHLPKTYFIILEWDTLKDEGVLYAQRLKEAGVDVKIAFYHDAFHGIARFIRPFFGFNIAREMQSNLITFIKENI